MKTKIIGIIVCVMLMTTFLTTAQNVENIPVRNESDGNDPISSYDVEAPVWKLGYKWIYKINKFTIDFKDTNYGFYMDIKIDDFHFEVTEVTEDLYELTFNSTCNGTFWVFFDLGDGLINISSELKSTKLDGTIVLNKTSMGIKEIHPKISGIFDVEIVEQPYIVLPFKLHKEDRVTIDLDIVFDDAHRPIVKFPFNMSDCWGLPSGNFTLGGTIETDLLTRFCIFNDIINPILKILNDTIGGQMISRLYEFSNLLKDICPVIDICYILTKYLDRECVFSTTGVPPSTICCLSKNFITVPAGTFECYNISILGTNIANIYYNTSIGAIVKFIGNLQDIIPSLSDIDIELIYYYIY
jgi:hypothetical protein